MAEEHHGVTVRLVVKASSREAANSIVAERMNAWFLEDWRAGREAPYPEGSLLWWGQQEEKATPIFTEGWLAVRQGEKGPWLDTSTLATLPEIAGDKACFNDHAIPWWAKIHPVVRMAKVRVEEVLQ